METIEDDWHEFDLASSNLSTFGRNQSNGVYSPNIAQPGDSTGKNNVLLDGRNVLHHARLIQSPKDNSTQRQIRPENVDIQTKTLITASSQVSRGLAPTTRSKVSSIPAHNEAAGGTHKLLDHDGMHSKSPAHRLQWRMRQGLQPRRHLQTPSRAEAISQWQASQAVSVTDDLEGLELPADCLRLTSHDLIGNSVATFESDNEDWGEGSLGIRHASRKPRSTRASTTSSMISASPTTDQSLDGLDGLELPEDMFDLRKRFLAGSERRAAGDTIKQSSRNHDYEQGLIIDHDSFVKAPRLVSRLNYSMPRCNKTRPGTSATKLEVDSIAALPSDDALNSTRFSESYAVPTTRRSELATGSRARYDELNPNLNTPAASRSSLQQQDSKDPLSQYLQVRSTKAAPFGCSKPAFLPSGSALDSSHHVSALQKRMDRSENNSKARTTKNAISTSCQRRVTASEALRFEASRYNTHTHVRAKTHGEGNELDDLDDLPARVTSRPRERSQILNDSRRSAHTTVPQKAERGTDWRESSSRIHSPCTGHQKAVDSPASRKKNRKRPALPGLISAINTTPIARVEKSMVYNPKTYKWEGNDQVLRHFDEVLRSPPRPALISNVGTSQPAVQVVNGMVFDPEQMAWIKLKGEDSEIDPFEHLDDFEHISATTPPRQSGSVQSSRLNLEHFSVGEEFDVGRQFIKKQREEEVKWRAQTRGWFSGRSSCNDYAYLQDIYALLTEDD